MRKDLCEQARAYALTLTLSLALTLHPHPRPRPRPHLHPHPHPKQFDAVLFTEEPGRCYGPVTTPAGLHLIFLHSCREPKSRGEVRAPPASHPASPPHLARISPRHLAPRCRWLRTVPTPSLALPRQALLGLPFSLGGEEAAKK